MVSATGLWDQNASDYDAETLAALPIRREQLADPASLDQPEDQLLPEYRALWPAFAKARWFPALGDGACNNLGSGCVSTDRAALMVGTTGAMRLVSRVSQEKLRARPRRRVSGATASTIRDSSPAARSPTAATSTPG